MSLGEQIRGIVHFDPKGWHPRSALLRAIGVAIPLVVGFFIGKPAWGVLASIGALYTGTASFGGIQPVRVQRMLVASVATAFITGLASLLNRGDALAVAGITVLAFGLALVGSLNSGANLVTVQAMGALIVVSGIPASSADPLGNALLVLGGGLVQTALLSIFGPLNPYAAERRAVGTVFRELGAFVSAQEQDHAPEIPNSDPFMEAIARLEEAEYHGIRPEHLPLQHAIRTAETIRAALVGYARAYRELWTSGGCPDWGREINSQLADTLARVGDRITEGQPPALTWALTERMPCPDEATGPLKYWLELIRDEIQDVSASEVKTPEPKRLSWIPRLESISGIFDSKLLQGLTLIHALRYAIAIGLTEAAARLSHVDHSYWFPLTVAFILRSDYATTLSRGVGRAAGTIIGVGIASAIDVWFHPAVWMLIILVVVSTWFAYGSYRASYTAYAFAVTLFVVFSISATGLPEREIGELRILATLLGVLASIIFTLIWPMWQSREVKGLMGDAFRAQADYGRAVEGLVSGKAQPDIEERRRKARLLRIEAQKLVAGAQSEPLWSQKDHLDRSSEMLAILAAGAAELLFVHAQAVSQARKTLLSPHELGAIAQSATLQAQSYANVNW